MSWVLPVITGVQQVMSVVAFIQFIEEEAIQACMLGAFLGVRVRNYSAARISIETTEQQLLPHLKTINTALGWLSPYSKSCFQDYIVATETMLQVYKDLLLSAAK